MYLTDLALSDFRNYAEAVVRFEPGTVVLLGRNGQGKTNLVEAIGYLSSFSSHRVSADTALVRAGAPGAVVRLKAVRGERSRLVELEVVAGRANRARLNRSPVKPREILGIVRTVLFAPEDLALVKGDPSDRRRFLDDLMVLRTPRLADVKSRYEKVVRQRAALLKSRRGGGGAASDLDVWDTQLAAVGADLMVARAALVQDLAPYIAQAYADLANGGAAAAALRTSLDAADERDGIPLPEQQPTAPELSDRLLGALRRARPRELERGLCLVGPHRDELALTIGELPARGYASHGESWSLALALKLASFHLLTEDDDDPPILILDDVFAELDSVRRARLVDMVEAAEQVFVTAAVAEDVPRELGGQLFSVVDGTIEEVSS